MNPKFFLFGCSHVGAIRRAALEMQVPFTGRPVMRGRYWDEEQFDFSDENGLVLHEEAAIGMWDQALSEAGLKSVLDVTVPIVTTIGFQLDRWIWGLAETHTISKESKGRDFVSSAAFEATIFHRRSKTLGLVRWLVSHGHRVICIGPPPRNEFVDLSMASEAIMTRELSNAGAEVHLTRAWSAGANGLLLDEYKPENATDNVHANTRYGRKLLEDYLLSSLVRSTTAPIKTPAIHPVVAGA